MSPQSMKPTLGEAAPAARVGASMTLNECVQLYPQTLPVFNQYGMDTCCGGARRIDDVAQRHGIDLVGLLEVLNWAAAGLRLDEGL